MGIPFVPLGTITEELDGKEIRIRGYLHTKRDGKKFSFFVLREGKFTVQVIVSKDLNPDGYNQESYIEVIGVVSKAKEVKSCSQKYAELQAKQVILIGESEAVLPIIPAQQDVDADKRVASSKVDMVTGLQNRVLDMRSQVNRAIFRISSGVGGLFRDFCFERDFVEIHTPKICPGRSEGGSNCFEFKFFDQDATLAQSPQLYKQMCVVGGLERVFEIAPAFRAEKSNTPRHLCEFTSMDFEMEITSFDMLLATISDLFRFIFDGLNRLFREEIAVVQKEYNLVDLVYAGPPVIIDYPEAVAMLSAAGVEQSVEEDIGTEAERKLGALVKEKYNTDIYILKHFPLLSRPFYTAPHPTDSRFSLSFDVELRGEEIVSGAQRLNTKAALDASGQARGIVIPEAYANSFRYGAPQHGGAGVGLERVTMLFLGLDNVKRSTLFPRFYGPMYS